MGGSNTDDYSTSTKEVDEYIGRKFDYGADIQRSLENEMKTGVPVPSREIGTEADGSLSGNQKFIWEKSMTEYVKRETKLDKNFQKAYALIFGQCTDHMHSKLEASEDYQTTRGNYDVLLLIAATKGLTYKFDGHNHQSHALHDAKQDFYCYYQTGKITNRQYLETYKNKVPVIELYGEAIGTDPRLAKVELTEI